jgi:hypothetical protein
MTACRPVFCRWWSSRRSRRVLLLALGGGASAPEGRTILPVMFRLHLPVRRYSSTSSQSLIRWPVMPQNLQRGAFLILPPGAVALALNASWPAVVACRLALRAAIACRSTSLLKAAASAGAGDGVVRACRNASTERGGVRMGGGAIDATDKIDGARRDGETEGAEHSDGSALVSEAAPCCATWNDCRVDGNRGKGAGTTGAGGTDVCAGIGDGESRRGACTRHASAGHGVLDVLRTRSACMYPCA